MQKILLFAAVFAVFLFPSTECRADVRYGNTVVLGDSIASGYGLPDYTSGNNYSAPLSWANMLGAECSRCDNFAVDGRNSAQLLQSLEQPTDSLNKSLSCAERVIISIGGNDFLGSIMSAVKTAALTDEEVISAIINGEFKTEMISGFTDRVLKSAIAAMESVDVDSTVSNIRKTTELISQINPNAQIILLTIYNPFSEHILLSGISETAQQILSELNGKIAAIADASPNVKIADVCAAFSNNALKFTNIGRLDIHPSEEGHNKIYRLLEDIISDSSSSLKS